MCLFCNDIFIDLYRTHVKLMQPPGPEAVKTYPLGQIVPGIFFDGVIGNGFYRRIGKKVLLDLDNMRLEAVQ